MSKPGDRDPKTGLFIKGNTSTKGRKLDRGLSKKIFKNGNKMLAEINQIGEMTLNELSLFLKNKGELTGHQTLAIAAWKDVRENPTPGMITVLFKLHGISLDNIYGLAEAGLEADGDDIKDVTPVNVLSKQATIDLLEKFKSELEKDDEA